MMAKTDIKKLRFIIVIHEETPVGPGFVLRDYLIERQAKELFFISHPLLYFKDSYKNSSRYEQYKIGKPVKKNSSRLIKLPLPLSFVKDFLYTLFWCIRLKGNYDVFFGIDPLSTLAGLILKKIGVVRKVVYYNIDFTPVRFKNKLLNYIYHAVDSFTCYNSDYNWVGTERTTIARVNSGMIEQKMAKIIVVPDGNNSHDINKRRKKIKVNINNLIYLGHLDKKQGIDLILDALPMIKKRLPNIKFIIIGKGDYEDSLRIKINKLKLDYVEFKGFIKSEKEVEDILLGSAVALAPYFPDKNSFTYYSEAGKPKYYLGCSLPVVITKVPSIANVIEDRRAGKLINYDKSELVDAVLSILDKKNYLQYRENARKLGLEFDYRSIFNKALVETISLRRRE